MAEGIKIKGAKAELPDPRVQNMSLRDYFAAQAMSGLLGCEEARRTAMRAKNQDDRWTDFLARIAYAAAESMMEVRKQ